MAKAKVEVIKKVRQMSCGRCHKTFNGVTGKRIGCPSCGGKGSYDDYHYTMIVGKYAYDMDTIK
jgi:Zn finger protein HypA/HybF involved in hydrogenase expression